MSRNNLHVTLGTLDVTEDAEVQSFSNSDPGGFETATLTLPAKLPAKKGDRLVIREGAHVVFEGRLNEGGQGWANGVATYQFSASGYKALFDDNPTFTRIYIDRDITRWHDPSTTRRIAIAQGSHNFSSWSAARDDVNGDQGLIATMGAPLNTPWFEVFYDAGQGNRIGRVRLGKITPINIVAPWTNVQFAIGVSDDDTLVGQEFTANIPDQASYDWTPNNKRRFLNVEWAYTSTAFGVSGTDYGYRISRISVIGVHTCPIVQGSGSLDGVLPADVVYDVLRDQSDVKPGRIESSDQYVIPHLVYYDAVARSKVFGDLIGLTGWHWGVWDSGTMTDPRPRLDYCAPPVKPTAYVSMADCVDGEISTSLDLAYDQAIIHYTTVDGVAGLVTVSSPNPDLTQAKISRTLELDIGTSSADVAKVFGYDSLLLQQRQGRGAGSVTLPRYVRMPGGGLRPAHTLRAGKDRLAITDIPDRPSLVGGNNTDFGTFHISRVECSIGDGGQVNARVELDRGASLLEVLQARLQVASGIAG